MPVALSSARVPVRVSGFGELTRAELEAWERLHAAEPDLRRAFLAPGFARAVHAARGGVRVAVWSADGAPAAFLPFQFASAWTRLCGAAEPVGGALSDGFGLVAARDARLTPGELLAGAGLAALDVHHLVDGQEERGLVAEEREVGLRVRFDDGWERYWAGLAERNKRFVQKTERRARNVESEHGPLVLDVAPAEPHAELDRLIAEKRAQYARTSVPDALRAPWKRRTLHALLDADDAGCRGALYVLRAGDTRVATHFGLVCGDVLHYWFPVYERDVAKHSPGHLLVRAIGERAEELGLRVIDRGAGDTQAKRSFADEEQRFGRGRWSRPGARSTLHAATCSLGWRLEALRGAQRED